MTGVMTMLTDAQTRSTSLLADDSAVENARLFVRAQLPDWGLEALAERAEAGVTELVGWVRAHEPHVLLEITLVWDRPLLFTEVADRRHEPLPRRPVWRVQDPEAVARLEAVALEWGAEPETRGRRLWASYSAEQPSGGSTEASG